MRFKRVCCIISCWTLFITMVACQKKIGTAAPVRFCDMPVANLDLPVLSANEDTYPEYMVNAYNQQVYRTHPLSQSYTSGRIVVGDSRCCQLGLYQQQTGGHAFAVFALTGGHYVNTMPYICTDEFYQSVEDCFHAQIEAKGKCEIFFFATVNDYDFINNENEENVDSAITCAEKLASMQYEYNGKYYRPTVTVIGIVAGSRDHPVIGYESRIFNRYEGRYNRLLRRKLLKSPILKDSAYRWTTVPEILKNRIEFTEDGLHFDESTLRRLASYIKYTSQ